MNTVFDDVTSVLPIHSGIELFFFILKFNEFVAVVCIRHHDVFIESFLKRSSHSTNHTFVLICTADCCQSCQVLCLVSDFFSFKPKTNVQSDTIPQIHADNTQN